MTMLERTDLPSRRLALLSSAVEQGSSLAVAEFWKEIALTGAPLIELESDRADPNESDTRLVTFVWRGRGSDTEVGVVSNLTGSIGVYERMTLLPGTDVWYRSYRLPADTRETYQISVNGENRLDPLNPKIEHFPKDEDTGVGGWESSILELPGAPPQPWIVPRAELGNGKIIKEYFSSAILGNTYPIWVYTPPSYLSERGPYGYLVMLDGWFYTGLIGAPTTLDHLISDGRLPPLAALMIGSLSYDVVRKRDYGCYPPYLTFLERELLPWARQRVNLSDDPALTTIVGVSRGGLMAGFIGLQMANIFGNVLIQSGALGWHPEGETEPDWLARQFSRSPRLPLQFYLEAGRFETRIDIIEGYPINILQSTRTLRDVLTVKGYPVQYNEFSGGHSFVNWRGTLANGLIGLYGAG